MKILQQPLKVKRNQIIQVHFDKPVVVKLMSKNMFPKYKNGAKHVAQGGFFEQSPAKFTIPYDGIWHAVIEKGSHSNPINVEGRVEVLPPEIKERTYFNPDDDEPTAIEEHHEEAIAESEATNEDVNEETSAEDEDDLKEE